MNKNGMGNATDAPNGKLDSIKDSVKGLYDQVPEKVEEIKAKATDVKDKAMSRGNEAIDKVSELVKAHPLKAVGIAFGVGYLGMRLFRR